MRTAEGTPRGLRRKAVIGRLTREDVPLFRRKDHILVSETPQRRVGYAGQVIEGADLPRNGIALGAGSHLDFVPGDIANLDADGKVHFVWESNSHVNALMVTEACNCRCVMCPQPPKPHDQSALASARRILSLVDSDYSGNVAVTGGEPTLLGDEFVFFLNECRKALPGAFINVLTNGKGFQDLELARKVALLGIKQCVLCVSLHADTDELHDEIVGRPGSFAASTTGLHNLARFRLPVEIRVVVLQKNWRRLPQIAEHIYRNHPYAYHVTFMALEMTGEAAKNRQDVWVDPWDYRTPLEVATHELHRRGMRVSVYNHQLCIVDPRVRMFARQSISPWKKAYLERCCGCGEMSKCCGFFTTSGPRVSERISPIHGKENVVAL